VSAHIIVLFDKNAVIYCGVGLLYHTMYSLLSYMAGRTRSRYLWVSITRAANSGQRCVKCFRLVVELNPWSNPTGALAAPLHPASSALELRGSRSTTARWPGQHALFCTDILAICILFLILSFAKIRSWTDTPTTFGSHLKTELFCRACGVDSP